MGEVSIDAKRSGAGAEQLFERPLAKTLIEHLARRAVRTPNAIALKFKNQNGQWESKTWLEVQQEAIRVAKGLSLQGIKFGDRVAIIAANSVRWEVFFYASLILGAVVVGIEPHAAANQKIAILSQSEAAFLAIDDISQLSALPESSRAQFKSIIHLAETEAPTVEASLVSWQTLLTSTGGVVRMERAVEGTAALLVYTSGTTGAFKGIVYSHGQVLMAAAAVLETLASNRIATEDRLVCWLPSGNLFQRMINVCALVGGLETSLVADPKNILSDLREIKPTIFCGIPLFYEKIAASIQGKVHRLPISLQRMVRPLVAHLLRALFGGRVRILISGSAPLEASTHRLFKELKLPVLEAYGLSENIIPIAINPVDSPKAGSVGKVLRGNQVKISRTGEVLVKGSGVATQYFRSTEPVQMDREGFLSTGDLGYFDNEGYLFLTGRRTDLIKTANGRKISPLRVEEAFRKVPAIDRVVVFGHGKSHLLAVLSLKEGEEGVDPANLRDDLVEVMLSLNKFETVSGFLVVKEKFSPSGGQLTANLKVKRAAIERMYRDDLEALYEKTKISSSLPIVEGRGLRLDAPVIRVEILEASKLIGNLVRLKRQC